MPKRIVQTETLSRARNWTI